MAQIPGFLPDLGEHLLTKYAGAATQVIGSLKMTQISRYRNEYYSITGSCAMEGSSYVATFDFDVGSWGEFAQHFQERFYLDVTIPETDG